MCIQVAVVSPGDCEIDSAFELLTQISKGKQGFICVGANAAIVVSELLSVLDDMAVELDHIRILRKEVGFQS
jgi:hypothetical protein